MRWAVVVFCAVIGLTLAAVEIGKLEPKPEKFKDTKGCYLSELDMVIPEDSSQPSTKQCLEYWCGKKWVTISSCGYVALGESSLLKLVEDFEKPYPDCCPSPINSTANE